MKEEGYCKGAAGGISFLCYGFVRPFSMIAGQKYMGFYAFT